MTRRTKNPGKPVDTTEPTRPRGRPAGVNYSETLGRADHYQIIFNRVWDRLWPMLSEAQNEADVKKAIREGAAAYAQHFDAVPAATVLEVIREPKFPKRRKSRINFLADSIAGEGLVSPRRSRDICAKERARAKRANHIIRYEFYIECSCSYKGQSRDHACPKCGAKINFEVGLVETL